MPENILLYLWKITHRINSYTHLFQLWKELQGVRLWYNIYTTHVGMVCWGHLGLVSVGCNHSSLQWRHNGRNDVSNQQPHDCLLNRLFRRRSKKTSKLRVTGLCARNSPVTGEFPAQMSSNTENVSISWRNHVHACNFNGGLNWLVLKLEYGWLITIQGFM